jgi:periplasmic protein TonB
MLLVIPLMATGALPIPKTRAMVMAVSPPPLPHPPPAPRAAAPKPAVNRDAAPVFVPDGITPEPDLDVKVEDGSAAEPGIIQGLGSDRIETVLAEPPPASKAAPPPPVHVGGQIKAPDKIRDVAPVYPPIALAARKEGVVIIEATIGVDGSVQDARVLRSELLLDQAALDAVRQWTFTPTTLNGVPVPVIMTVTVRFQMQR